MGQAAEADRLFKAGDFAAALPLYEAERASRAALRVLRYEAYSVVGTTMFPCTPRYDRKERSHDMSPRNQADGLVLVTRGSLGSRDPDILVGNFGGSHISAFNPTTDAFLGQMSDAQGHPITFTGGFQGLSVKGLWGLSFGNGGAAGPANTLFFNSGINDESDGLFGSVTATSVGTATASSVASVSAAHGHGRTGTVAAQVDPTSSLLVPMTTADVSAFLGTVQDQHGHAHVDAALESLQDG